MTDGPSQQTDQLDALYRQNSRELWAIFYSQCSDPERAYDAVQEAFLRYHSYSGEPIRDPRAWLLRVGQNWLRDVARRKSSSCKLTSTLDEMTNSERSAPEDLMSSDENREVVREALTKMIEDDRKVLVMKYALNWSSAQMAKVMVCTAAAIDMRLSRARRRLAELLVEQGYAHE
ncbi:MAG: sigma-70 family RNA polymerase sigma factor [Planctomycetaceae bacterium]|nr:sigma-70 family RNA polymerase sigma factor [Planctomycetaceae bacterium]